MGAPIGLRFVSGTRVAACTSQYFDPPNCCVMERRRTDELQDCGMKPRAAQVRSTEVAAVSSADSTGLSVMDVRELCCSVLVRVVTVRGTSRVDDAITAMALTLGRKNTLESVVTKMIHTVDTDRKKMAYELNHSLERAVLADERNHISEAVLLVVANPSQDT